MDQFKGGDHVRATEDIYHTYRYEVVPRLLASKGQDMIVRYRSGVTIEVSTFQNRLFTFDVQPHQIELVKTP